jgi:hypothetical protein
MMLVMVKYLFINGVAAGCGARGLRITTLPTLLLLLLLLLLFF